MDDPAATVPPATATVASSNPPTSAPTSRNNSTNNGDDGSIKETIEQILVAFILAFIFRAYVVEAFVIPTGSMAPTLLGAHMRFTCPDCGYQFDVNFNARQDGEDLNIPSRSVSPYESSVLAICPNCSYKLRNSEMGDPAYAPFVRYGDRILVLKFLYLFEDPKRWDVVVFKAPPEPKVYDYSQNYIKRLIGRPGEAIMILDGDIYAGPTDAAKEDLKIQTKPRDVQNALWRLLHDSDYVPRGVPRAPGDNMNAIYKEPWTQYSGQTGWATADPSGQPLRTFTFDNDKGTAEIFYHATANQPQRGKPSAFSDWLAYDVSAGPPSGDWSRVSDLKLSMIYERKSGDGPLRLTLSKNDELFVAEITRDTARLLRIDKTTQTEVIPATKFAAKSGPMRIEFTNVDYRVTLRIDDHDVWQTNEQQYHPDVAALLEDFAHPVPVEPQVRIGASNQHATLSHVSLWRDVYYLSRGQRPGVRTGLGEPFAGSPSAVMRLNKDEYFVLGDNSQISGDGRFWTDPTHLPHEGLEVDAGKVPARFMLGKAFFVYWPAGYRPFESSPALAPDFGDMRFIH